MNDAELVALDTKSELLELLPRGKSTAVALVGEEDADGARGIGLPVKTTSAKLMLHSMQRSARRLKDVSEPRLVLFPGQPDSDQSCLILLTKHASDVSALRLSQLGRSGTPLESFSALIDGWKRDAGLRLVSVDEGWAEFELDTLPEDPAPLVADLVKFTYAGDIEADTLLREVSDRLAVRLAF